MTISQSRLVAMLGHHPDVSSVRPLGHVNTKGVRASLEGDRIHFNELRGFEDSLPGAHLGSVSAWRGDLTVDVFPG